MLVPVRGGVAELQKRNRPIFDQQAALETIDIPNVYIFNVGPREWRGIGGGTSYTVPACKPGQPYSEPVVIPSMSVSEFDPADGANNMGIVVNPGMSGTRKVGGEFKKVFGVANDVIGMDSCASACEMTTTNGLWWGVFCTMNEEPSAEELASAHAKLREMMQLIYAQGKGMVEQNMPENPIPSLRMTERRNYNEAADYLGYKPLWGEGDSLSLETCPECREKIQAGANYCKHCQQAIDPASVAVRIKQRAKNAAKLNQDEPS